MIKTYTYLYNIMCKMSQTMLSNRLLVSHKAGRLCKAFLVSIIMMLSALNGVAQDIIVTLTPAQQVLPPQVLLYLSDPGKYFTITLTNTSQETQSVYLGLQIEQINPASDLAIATPPKRQPRTPFSVASGASYTLSSLEMQRLFDHIPANEMSCPPGLFEDYRNGSFGLLPEGQYQARVTAYKWSNPQLAAPVVVSNPNGGSCVFSVCYIAQSPQFLTPSTLGCADPNVAEISPMFAQFTWTPSMLNCNSALINYTYDFKVVEVLNNQTVDDAFQRNPTVYQTKNLRVPQCIIPSNVISSNFMLTRKYAAQITAKAASAGTLNYAMVANDGKSDYKVFKVVLPNQGDNQDDEGEDPGYGQGENNNDNDDDNDDDNDIKSHSLWLDTQVADSLNNDSLYTFRNPTITQPVFGDLGARKIFVGNDIDLEWYGVRHMGGEGENPEKLEFDYEVQLFDNRGVADMIEALAGEPIYSQTVKNGEKKVHTIPWSDIEELVEAGDYLVLRVKPVCTNATSVAYAGDSLNVVDFALCDFLSKKYFQCSNTVEIDNYVLTEKSASQLKGKTVAIGEYNLTLSSTDLTKKKDGTFSGKGKVEWNPLGTTVMVCVKFDSLKINTDDMVIGGTAYTYKDPAANNDAAKVEKLFSEWGIDNLIGDANIPYANQITNGAKDKVTDLAKQLGLSKYYEYYRLGSNVSKLLGKGNIDELYLPIKLPDDMTANSPVNLQIAGMKFAATYATMDVVGELVIDDCNYIDNDILVFGAPRLCMSPNTILPESGTVALLSDFTVLDPNSTYTCTFKSPENLLEPQDGCFISWHNYEFEMLGVDIDMTIPHVKKESNINENAVLNLHGEFSEWANWHCAATIDPFQVDDLPGWTFTASDIIYDHAQNWNDKDMGSFPSRYDKKKNSDIAKGNIEAWQGLYIKTIAIEFPESFSFNVDEKGNGGSRLKVYAKDMFFDNSGVTLAAGINNAFSGETAKLGGWKFSLDQVELQFIQSDFNNCRFAGQLGLPLLTDSKGNKASLAYECQIRKQRKNGKVLNNTAYTFTVQPTDEKLNLDLFLAKVKFTKALTYLALESAPDDKGKMDTKVELVMGGEMEIGCTDAIQDYASKIKIDVEVPQVHFVGLRFANCDIWSSEYSELSDLQKAAKNDKTKIKTTLRANDGKATKISDSFYISKGGWSLASAKKKLGPFEFSLEKYDIKTEKSGSDMRLALAIAGRAAVVKGIDLSAEAAVKINTTVKNLSDFSNLSVQVDSMSLDSIGIHTSFCGITLDGRLKQGDDATHGKGFLGSLDICLPGDLFKFRGAGGYFNHDGSSDDERYTWGFLVLSLKSKAGIPIPPLAINGVTGGFYFNCQRSGSDAKRYDVVTAKNGAIGIVAGISLTMIDGNESTIHGDFTMTVGYDKNRDGHGKGGLTQFLFLGEISALDDMVQSDVKLLYENTSRDEYFQCNITADIKTDNSELLGGLNKFYEKASNFASKTSFKKLEEEEAKNTKNKNGGGVKVNNSDKNQKSASLCSAQVTLDLKVTIKEDGKVLPNKKWHLWIGEPDEDKRCKLTLIDFKSSVVSLTIGANAYICVGNELPNDGQLPPIPSVISNFLNGSAVEGVISDDVSAANASRTAAMRDFGGQTKGGVMFGAMLYGSLNLNLGIISGDMTTYAGFDMSLRKQVGAVCANTGGSPGWHSWYGNGQLYAYFNAKLGLNVDLDFVQIDWPLVNGTLGGVLEMGAPNPSYFMGKLRAKLEILNGLFSIDKKFEFECGNVCQVFHGNPLDHFQLFQNCNLGDSIRSKGWDDSNKISSTLRFAPYVETTAGINQHFRILDENELDRKKKNYKGDVSKLEQEAERTFVFRTGADTDKNLVPQCIIYEYSNPGDYVVNNNGKVTRDGFRRSQEITLRGGPTHYLLNLATVKRFLMSNMYYRVEFKGYAKEIADGREVDPVTYDTKAGYRNRPWKQTMNFFFCTKADDAWSDSSSDLQDYVAIAYPSYYNNIKFDKQSRVNAYVNDVKAPTIALTKNLYGTAYKQGKLYWRLMSSNGRELERSENAWVVSASSPVTCNMEPQFAFTSVKPNTDYELRIDYVTYKNVSNKVTTDTLNVATMPVHTLGSNDTWLTGMTNDYGNHVSLPYEYPFVGQSLLSYTWNGKLLKSSYWDVEYATGDGMKDRRLMDPFLYIGYMSNYALVGGWKVSASAYKLDVTTSESLRLRMEGAGTYEGKLDASEGYHVRDDYNKIKDMFFYDKNQYSGIYGSYPLPAVTNSAYDYVLLSDKRSLPFEPASEANAIDRVKNHYLMIGRAFDAVQNYSKDFVANTQFCDTLSAGVIKSRLAHNRGLYVSNSNTFSLRSSNRGVEEMLTTPIYQCFITAGSANGSVPLQNIMPGLNAYSRGKSDIQKYIAYNLGTPSNLNGNSARNKTTSFNSSRVARALRYYPGKTLTTDGNETFSSSEAKKLLTEAEFHVYRVNTYDITNGLYTISKNLQNGLASEGYTIKDPLLYTRKLTGTVNSPGNNSGSTKGATYGVSSVGGSSSGSYDNSQYGDDKIVKTIRNNKTTIGGYYDECQLRINQTNDLLGRIKSYAQNVKTLCARAVSQSGNARENSINEAKTYDGKASSIPSSISSYSNFVNSQITKATNELSTMESNINRLKTVLLPKDVKITNAQKDYEEAANYIAQMRSWKAEIDEKYKEALSYRKESQTTYNNVRTACNNVSTANSYASQLNSANGWMRQYDDDAKTQNTNCKTFVSNCDKYFKQMEQEYNIYVSHYNKYKQLNPTYYNNMVNYYNNFKKQYFSLDGINKAYKNAQTKYDSMQTIWTNLQKYTVPGATAYNNGFNLLSTGGNYMNSIQNYYDECVNYQTEWQDLCEKAKDLYDEMTQYRDSKKK